MLFSWDAKKAEANLKKHRVSFEAAQTVFDDPFHLSILDARSRGEERWVTIGQTASQKVLVVVHTYRIIEDHREMIRIVSARKATPKEARQYEEGI